MITAVYHKGFKGLPDKETPLGRLTFLTGPNGAGKTAVTQAIILTTEGKISGIANTNPAVMEVFGNAKSLSVRITKDGVRFDRTFAQKLNYANLSSVIQKFQVDTHTVNEKEFNQVLGSVKIFDLFEFQKMSEQKKIDMIFKLFPPADDYRDLSNKIEVAKTLRNSLSAKIEGYNATLKTLVSTKNSIQFPVGTLSEISAQIEEVKTQLTEAQKQLTDIQMEDRVREERERSKLEAQRLVEQERLRVVERERVHQGRLDAQVKANTENEARIRAENEESMKRVKAQFEGETLPPLEFLEWKEMTHLLMVPKSDYAKFINSLLSTMQRTGCDTCAAALVCKMELRKLKEVNNG